MAINVAYTWRERLLAQVSILSSSIDKLGLAWICMSEQVTMPTNHSVLIAIILCKI